MDSSLVCILPEVQSLEESDNKTMKLFDWLNGRFASGTSSTTTPPPAAGSTTSTSTPAAAPAPSLVKQGFGVFVRTGFFLAAFIVVGAIAFFAIRAAVHKSPEQVTKEREANELRIAQEEKVKAAKAAWDKPKAAYEDAAAELPAKAEEVRKAFAALDTVEFGSDDLHPVWKTMKGRVDGFSDENVDKLLDAAEQAAIAAETKKSQGLDIAWPSAETAVVEDALAKAKALIGDIAALEAKGTSFTGTPGAETALARFTRETSEHAADVAKEEADAKVEDAKFEAVCYAQFAKMVLNVDAKGNPTPRKMRWQARSMYQLGESLREFETAVSLVAKKDKARVGFLYGNPEEIKKAHKFLRTWIVDNFSEFLTDQEARDLGQALRYPEIKEVPDVDDIKSRWGIE